MLNHTDRTTAQACSTTLVAHQPDALENSRQWSPKPRNPFAAGNVGVLTDLLVSLMVEVPRMAPEQNKSAADGREASVARYRDQQYGALSDGSYRLLEQGGISGWRLELEIDGVDIVLRTEEGGADGAFAVYSDRRLADSLAKLEIARRHGDDAAHSARFVVVRGGKL
jgi:hypothetical protein